MRAQFLSLTLLLTAVPLVLPGSSAAADATADTYIVTFSEPPLAAFRGFPGDADPQRAALKATHPGATGAERLDVEAPASVAYRTWLDGQRARHLKSVSARLGRAITPTLTLDVVNHAAVLTLTADEAARLMDLPGIAQVEREWVDAVQTDAGPQWIKADQIWSGDAGVQTRGAGVVVGIIDTGINSTHSSFAGIGPVDGHVHVNPRNRYYGLCATTPSICNTKLIGIHDFTVCTGQHANSECDDREPNTGLDPDGHGSHVASTAAGNRANVSLSLPTGTVTRQISGVAPHANLISYKACEEVETCRGSWLLAAINQAVVDRVDVINYSIGGSARDPWTSSDATAMLNAREAGIVVVVAAGNNGPRAGSVTAPGNAPWVLTVANATHDRAIVNRLVDLSGGTSAPPQDGVLVGVGSTLGYGPAPLRIPADFPGCSVGNDTDSPPNGASNPWSRMVFNGEIVVCERGVQARVAKSNNVRLAGGGGMVLINTAADGESVVSDAHSIPGTHVGYRDGLALKQWLSSGSGHRGRIEGARIVNDVAFADALASSSGRGPNSVESILKPQVTAPGTSILAAAGTGTGFAFLSGTSMASPHTAGAAALLRATRPGWDVAAIESALITTAQRTIKRSDGNGLADVFGQGAGRVDVATATRAGLSFPITTAAFRAARPSLGGRPESLNLPSLIQSNCVRTCRFSRQVRDLIGGGRWRIEADLPDGLRLASAGNTFELGAGATQTLDLVFVIDQQRLLGQWLEGTVRLVPFNGSNTAVTHVPLSLYASAGNVTDRIQLIVDSDRGYRDIQLPGLVALADIHPSGSDLVAPQVRTEQVAQDPTNTSVYDSFGTGTMVQLIRVPAGSEGRSFRLDVALSSPEAVDVDLFVGRDLNGNGLPDAAEELCRSTSATASERCTLEINGEVGEQTYWILGQNWQAQSAGALSTLVLEHTLLGLSSDGTGALGLTTAASIPDQSSLPLRLNWDAPDLLPGERRIGSIALRATGDAAQPFARITVELQRSSEGTNAARILAPGRSLSLRLPGNGASERLFIDVPPNASALTIRSLGASEVDLYAAYVASPSSPTIAAAPSRDLAQARVTGSEADKTLRVSGAILRPGRWYITPVNRGSGVASFSLEVDVEYQSDRATPRLGAYFNPASNGSGLFLFELGNVWGLSWYTYLQDGTPTWYQGVNLRPGARQGIWQMDLARYRWNGEHAIGTTIGEAILSLTGNDTLHLSWSLDGESGSEAMSWLGENACAQHNEAPFPASGFWFSPLQPGPGYVVVTGNTVENITFYFYDEQGVGRWAQGSSTFNSTAPTDIPLDWRTGSCPLCSYAAPIVTPGIGILKRTYADSASGHMSTDVLIPPPRSGDWQIDLPAVRMSDAVSCP